MGRIHVQNVSNSKLVHFCTLFGIKHLTKAEMTKLTDHRRSVYVWSPGGSRHALSAYGQDKNNGMMNIRWPAVITNVSLRPQSPHRKVNNRNSGNT